MTEDIRKFLETDFSSYFGKKLASLYAIEQKDVHNRRIKIFISYAFEDADIFKIEDMLNSLLINE